MQNTNTLFATLTFGYSESSLVCFAIPLVVKQNEQAAPRRCSTLVQSIVLLHAWDVRGAERKRYRNCPRMRHVMSTSAPFRYVSTEKPTTYYLPVHQVQ